MPIHSAVSAEWVGFDAPILETGSRPFRIHPIPGSPRGRIRFSGIFLAMPHTDPIRPDSAHTDPARQLLRHTVAALAYRAARALEAAPDHFAGFAGAGRTPIQILAHMGDLFDWALGISLGDEQWHAAQPRVWAEEQGRFFGALKAFDDFLASDAPIKAPIDRLMQGPVADALTHIGQLAMMRRLSGSPTAGENFFIANVSVGRVGADQPAPVQPFK